jgi:hypothetical protein
MPTRLLRDTTDSDRINRLSERAELLFYRLIMKADDYGRFRADPEQIRSLCFPFGRGEITTEICKTCLKELERHQLIVIYKRSTKEYLSIVSFRQRMRAEKSKFPEPVGKLVSWMPVFEDFDEVAAKCQPNDGQLSAKCPSDDGVVPNTNTHTHPNSPTAHSDAVSKPSNIPNKEGGVEGEEKSPPPPPPGEPADAGVVGSPDLHPKKQPKGKVKEFIKPSLEEWFEYAQEIDYPPEQAESLWNFYESNGWKVGKNPMVKWKNAMRNGRLNWEQKGKPKAPKKPNALDGSFYGVRGG